MPVPDPQGFDVTRAQLHTAYQWIGHSLTGSPHTEADITRTLTGSADPETTTVQLALALLLVVNLAAAPSDRDEPRHDQPQTLGTAEGGQAAMATITHSLANLRRTIGLPPAPDTEPGPNAH